MKQAGRANYSLAGSTLTLHASGLAGLVSPVTIDPSIVVTTTADFMTGNNEGMISFDTDAISRTNRSGGDVGGWTATNAFTTARSAHASVAYNGYLYVTGGWDGTNSLDDVQFAPINADGTIGTWTATTSLAPYPVHSHTSVAYNGYLYVIGGNNNGTPTRQILYSPFNADGTIGNWTVANQPAHDCYNHTSVAYHGSLYVIGGRDLSQQYDDVQFAPIRADGSLGTFTTTTSFTTARESHASVAYNGYLYVIGGYSDTSFYLNDVQYAAIHADGTVGTWQSTTFLGIIGRAKHAAVAANGYLYILGGFTTGDAYTNTVLFATINANGSLGPWTATTVFWIHRCDHASVAYNGYLYVIGGGWDGNTFNDVQFAAIEADISLQPWVITTDLPDTRSGHTSVVYNGYMYVIGGQVGVGDKVRIESQAVIGAQAGIPTGKIVRRGSAMWGTPARPMAEFKKTYAQISNLPKLARKVNELARRAGAPSGSERS
jgi:N-acetylneuraminic acid mutarotase